MVLLAMGVKPNTEIIQSVVTLENNQAKCNSYLMTSDPNIFAAGDICSYPSFNSGERTCTGHVINAQQQGAIAALNMQGKNASFDYIPFFWTKFFGKTLQFVGNSNKYDEIIIDGDLKDMKFKAYYIKNRKLVGFAAMNSPNSANIIYEAFRNRYVISASSIKNGEITIDKLKQILEKIPAKCTKIDCLCYK
jgi:NADPH-dependent 2,4-dienoyl-CoA reductase/sulfur reductase-like enzyme